MKSFIRVNYRIRLEFEGESSYLRLRVSSHFFFSEEYLIYCIAFLESDDNRTR